MYRSIDTALWSDPKVRSMSSEGKLLFIYLITNSHAHLSGIYYLPLVTVAHELGIEETKIRYQVDTLSNKKLVMFDDDFEIFWVVNMLFYQGRGSKIMTSVSKQLESLHDCPLIERFLNHYKHLRIKAVAKKLSKPDTKSIPHPKLDGVGLQEQEQEQDKDKKKEPLTPLVSELELEPSDDAPAKASATAPKDSGLLDLEREFVANWNRASGIVPIRSAMLTDKRRNAFRARVSEPGWLEAVPEALDKFPLKITVGRAEGWKPDADWFLKPDSVTKILEGKYDWNPNDGKRTRDNNDYRPGGAAEAGGGDF
jgi:hypothetical protein